MSPDMATPLELFEDDPQSFFSLATTKDLPDRGSLKDLQELVHRVGRIVASGYHFQPSDDHTSELVTGGGAAIGFDVDLLPRVKFFFSRLNGISRGRGAGQDYRGRAISSNEVAFWLGDVDSWESDERRVAARNLASPKVLQLDPADRYALQNTPGYCLNNLKYCANRIVQAPRAVFHGLRERGKLKDGIAYCGNPPQMYDNRGTVVPVPSGFIFAVFADAEGYVFDWDWLRSDPNDLDTPVQQHLRFAKRVSSDRESVLIGVEDLTTGEFRESAWHSFRGDCVFYYLSDAPSYAERVDDDLTVFWTFEGHQMTGCKVKNIEAMRSRFAGESEANESELPVLHFLGGSLALQSLNGSGRHYAELIKHANETRPKVRLQHAPEVLQLS